MLITRPEASQNPQVLLDDAARTGLLGADLRAQDRYYRIVKICCGEDEDDRNESPLTVPGLRFNEGDYLIAVEGKPVRTDVDIRAAFLGMAGKKVRLTINSAPSKEGSWEIVVKTVADEAAVRYADWVRCSSARVAEALAARFLTSLRSVRNAGSVHALEKGSRESLSASVRERK